MEALEARILLSAVSIPVTEFDRLDPAGGLLFVSDNNNGQVEADTDLDFEFFAENGQTISAIVRPTNPNATVQVSLLDLGKVFQSPSPGEAAVLGPMSIISDNTYTARIESQTTTNVTVEIFRNTSLEAEVGDTANDNTLAIDRSFIDPQTVTTNNSGRFAVLGSSDPPLSDTDAYTITFDAGTTIDVILDGQDTIDFTGEQLDLLGPNGSGVLATAVSNPLGVPAGNYDLGILGFVVPEAGQHVLRLSSQVEGEYAIVVTIGAGGSSVLTFESEPNDAPDDPLRRLNGSESAIGALGATVTPGTDLIQDGGFELGRFGGAWNESSVHFDSPICNVTLCGDGGQPGPRTGEYWVWFGGNNDDAPLEASSVSQNVIFPSGTTTLTFFLEISTTVDPVVWGFDSLELSIDGTVVFKVTDDDTPSYPNYKQIVLDVSDFADRETHNLTFRSATNGLIGVTNFFVDDVELFAGPFIPGGTVDPAARTTKFAKTAAAAKERRALAEIDHGQARTLAERQKSETDGQTTISLSQRPSNQAAWTGGLTAAVSEEEPNDTIGTANPLPLGFDQNEESAIDVTGVLGDRDVDYFQLELEAGDILGANLSDGGQTISFQNSTGFELMGSQQDATFIHPPDSPLPGGGNAALAWVVDTTDTYIVRVSDGGGPYRLNLRVFRPVLEATPAGTHQVLFLDFDGALIDTSVFGETGLANLSPLVNFMQAWGLDPVEDLDAVIDSLTATVEENLSADIRAQGNNGDFAARNVPGEFDIEILNSRDHTDRFEQAHVSRVILGGTVAEFGIDTIAISQSIDVGNFDTAESAVVLLDTLSGPDSEDSINSVPLADGALKSNLVGVVLGNTVSQMAGHLFGNFHTDHENSTLNLMDRGGNGVATDLGVGPDGLFGSSDDIDADFGDDAFSQVEGFTGVEDTLNRIAFGLSTGKIDLALVGPSVLAIDPPAGPTDRFDINEIMVAFSEPVSAPSATNPNNYQLLEAGANGSFEGGDDDVSIPVTVVFDGQTKVTLEIDSEFAPMIPGRFELTIKDGIVDLDGNALNSLTGSDGGSDHVHTFEVFFELGPDGDLYLFSAVGGEFISVTTQTPFDDAATTPLNDLDPKLLIIGPSGLPMAADEDSLDGKNAMVNFTATDEGVYTVQVLAESGSGEYLLDVTVLTSVGEFDYGDAPIPYPTFIPNGARHKILPGGPVLGTDVDAEPNGIAHPLALGDDNTDVDDEESVTFKAPLTADSQVEIDVIISNAGGFLNAWIDFNADGDWSDAGESIFSDQPVNIGTNRLTFFVPDDAFDGFSFARFRVSTEEGLSFTGAAADGEVEDHRIELLGDNVGVTNDFSRLQPPGGLIFTSTGNEALLTSDNDHADFEFFLEAGQTLSAIARSDETLVTLAVTLVDVTAPTSAPGPGEPAVLRATAIESDGIYTVRVSADQTTTFTLDLVRNAALEAQVGQSGIDNALAIDASRVKVGLNHYAVLGEITAVLPEIDVFTLDLTGQVGQTIDVILTGQDGADFTTAELELIDPSGTIVFATATSSPDHAANYDLAILDFVVPSPSIYALRLTSDVHGEYRLIVTVALTIETEPNDSSADRLRGLDETGSGLGFIGDVTGPIEGGVVDGSFELGPYGGAWNEFSFYFTTPICDVPTCGDGDGTGPNTGSHWAWFGGNDFDLPFEDASVNQQVVMPTGTATLSFFLEIRTTVSPLFNGIDSLTVNIDDSVVFTVTDELTPLYHLYTPVVVDVSNFADGGTHRLEFASVTAGLFGVTNFFVDDIALVPGPIVPQRSDSSGTAVISAGVKPRTAWANDMAVAAQLAVANAKSRASYVPNQLIVRYADDEHAGVPTADLFAKIGGELLSDLDVINGALIEFDSQFDMVKLATTWSAHPAILYAEPNYLIQIADTLPNDQRFNDQWGLHNTGQTGGINDADIDAPAAWDVLTGSNQVVIASIDTGVDYTHPDLVANMWSNPGEIAGDGIDNDNNGYIDDIFGIDTINNDSDPFDDNNHGTHTAGTFGAVGNNSIGVAGVNWNVQIMALKFIGADGTGETSDAIEAIEYMTMMKTRTQNPVNIVASNNSWGSGEFSASLRDAIANSIDAGIMFVVAAGNGGPDGLGDNNDQLSHFPSNFDLDGIIAVAATDHRDEKAIFSNFGANTVDLGAPGVSILSTTPNNGYSSFSGTSMASPHVAGAVGMLSALNPDSSLEEIKAAILLGADPIPALSGITVSDGRLNLANALNLVGQIGPVVVAIDPPQGAVENLEIEHLTIEFSEPISVESAINPSHFHLRQPGVNRVFEDGSGDDVDIGLTITFDGDKIVTATIDSAFTPLPLGPYRIVIEDDIQDLNGNPLNSTTGPGGGLRHVHEFEVVFDLDPNGDLYTLNAASGQFMIVTTQTLFDNALSTPLNDLDPKLVVIGPSGLPIAQDRNSLDGKNAVVAFSVPEDGTYFLQVLAESGTGEYRLSVREQISEGDFDFGDAPLPFTVVPNGARHGILNYAPVLGFIVDSEPNGQPDPNARGDDNANLDDEDGVEALTPLVTGFVSQIAVSVSTTSGWLSGWIDFNANGDWDDAEEQIFVDELLNIGTTTLSFVVPIDAAVGHTFARYRLSSQRGLSFDGSAFDGEVEDYEVEILANVTQTVKAFVRTMPLGGLIHVSKDNLGHISAGGLSVDFEFFAESGQTIAAIARPDNPEVTLQVSLIDKTSVLTPLAVDKAGLVPWEVSGTIPGTLTGVILATMPGAPAVLPVTKLPELGTYSVRVGADGTTNFTLDLVRNASLEAQFDDNQTGVKLAIDDSFIDLGSGRYGVVGQSEPNGQTPDVDFYTLDLTGRAGQVIDIVLAGHDQADFESERFELLDTDGSTVRATAVTNPLGTNATTYDLGILGFVVPADGKYTMRLSSSIEGDYGIVITVGESGLTFDSEPNDDLDQSLRSLDTNGAAIGFLGTFFGHGDSRLVDGGFEQGRFGGAWDEASTYFGTPICDTECGTGGSIGPHSGDFWAWFGGNEEPAFDETSSISQDVVFPNGTATLTFFLDVFTDIESVVRGFDILIVSIDGTIIFTASDDDEPTYSSYTQIVLDVSDFADGESHNLRFESVTVGLLGVTSFHVDDVELFEGPFTAKVPVPIFSQALRAAGNPSKFGRLLISPSSPMAQTASKHAEHVPNRLIVRYADDINASVPRDLFAARGGTVIDELQMINGVLVEFSDNKVDLRNLSAAWSAYPSILYAEPDYIIHTTDTVPSDPRFGELWGLNNTGQTGGTDDADIDAPQAWDLFTGLNEVVIASIDSGVDYTHPDLAANMWSNPGEIAGDGIDNDNNGYIDDIFGIDTANNDSDPFDDNEHGTHTAGTFGAVPNNGIGVVGVNWNVRIMALKFIGADGTGTNSAAIKAIDYMTMMKTRADNPVNIVVSNNSWGSLEFSQSLKDSIAQSIDAGIMFVAAAGNGGPDLIGDNNDLLPHYPSNFDLDGIIAVAATNHNDLIGSFSNFGAKSVDLGAPGVSILSTTPGNAYSTFSGTSMASPHVAGAVGLLRAANPDASLAEMKAAIMLGADPIPAMNGITVSGGRLNLANSLNLIGNIGPTVAHIDPPAGEVDDLNIKILTITYSESITPTSALDSRNYRMLIPGPNGVFESGGGDDISIPLGLAFDGINVVTLIIDEAFSPLFLGPHELTIGAGIEDLEANPLNSTTGPGGGRDHTHAFEIVFNLEPNGDLYAISVESGQLVEVTVQTLFDHSSSTPLNDLEPKLVIVGPSGLPVSTERDSVAGKIARVKFTAPEDGTYKVQVLAESGTGEYLLTKSVEGTGVIVDNLDESSFALTGTWFESSAVDAYESSSLFTRTAGATATWAPNLSEAGTYRVYIWWGTKRSNGTFYDRDSRARYKITHGQDVTTLTIDQDMKFGVDRTGAGGRWLSLGTFALAADGTDQVKLVASGTGPNGTSADAVRFEKANNVADVIVDNSDSGFSTVGQWATSSAVDFVDSSSLFSKQNGATATWAPNLSEAGTYRVYIWWSTKRSNGTFYDRDSRARYEITHGQDITTLTIDQDMKFGVDRTRAGGRWLSLGTFDLAADGTDQVKLVASGTGPNGTSADAVRFEKANNVADVIVDNSDSGFSTVGQWGTSSAVDFVGSSSLFSKQNGATATWRADLPEPGMYNVHVWWAGQRSNGNSYERDSAARYEVAHDGGTTTIIADQDTAHGQWVLIGAFEFADVAEAQIKLTVSGTGPNGTSADAVRFERNKTVPVDVVADNSDQSQFAQSGQWRESGAVDEFDGSSLFSKQAGATATWSPSFPEAGPYSIFAWWSARKNDGSFYNRDSVAQFEISHAGGITTRDVDQNHTSGGWFLLGTFNLTADGSDSVTLISSGTGPNGTSADAIRFIK